MIDYKQLAIDKGFEPWGGGAAAPDDWDGGEVLLRAGNPVKPGNGNNALSWCHPHDSAPPHLKEAGGDIIGYRKRTTAAAPTSADTVTIARMTEAEVRERWPDDIDDASGAERVLRHLGLIREETIAERFTRETGITITPEIEKALSWNR